MAKTKEQNQMLQGRTSKLGEIQGFSSTELKRVYYFSRKDLEQNQKEISILKERNPGLCGSPQTLTVNLNRV